MSGIFRHSAPASNNNNSSEASPNRRISFGAFGTNPGFLQDVTMDNAYGVGYRSPCVSLQQYHGATSPAVQGRSVRDFEEQTAALRKENFNLKLRLYFIEENIPALKSNGAEGCDTAMRELIEHKVEVEMLRRELEEKKAVLKDALQAIEDLEKIQKDTELNYEAKMEDLKQKIQFLEVDRSADKSDHNNEFLNNILGRSDIAAEHFNNFQRIHELEALVKTGEETMSELENKVTFLDGILAKRDQSIKELEERIKSLEYKNAELQEQLDEMKGDNATSEANLSLRAQNSERLLERFRELEKCIDRMRDERNLSGRKNRFLCGVIKKLRNQLERFPKSAVQQTVCSSEKFQRKVTIKRIMSSSTKTAALKSSSGLLFNPVPIMDHQPDDDDDDDDAQADETGSMSSDLNYDHYYRDGGRHHRRRRRYAGDGNGGDGVDVDDEEEEDYNEEISPFLIDESEINISDIDADEIFDELLVDEGINCNDLYLNSSSALKQTSRGCNGAAAGAAAATRKEGNNFRWHLQRELKQLRIELADKLCLTEELEEKLAAAQQKNDRACSTIQALTQTFKLHQAELKRLKELDEGLAAASSDSLHAPDVAQNEKTADCVVPSRSLSDINSATLDASKHELETKVELQERIIRSLRAEVKKKTADLQNIVNKELWGKNREIERLTKLLNEGTAANLLTSPNPKSASSTNESAELQQSFTEQEYAKALERNRLLQLKVDILIQRLGAERENEVTVSKLRHEVHQARTDAENAERFRSECADLCAVLTERLEELAGFLNSLLKHKDVLGFLAADRRRAIRKAVDRSLDLSKSLNRTLSLSGVSMTEHSLAQLCNLSEILGNVSTASIDLTECGGGGGGGGEAKTFNSHEEACAIETLKAENKALKKELDKRRCSENKKDRRSLPAAAAALENQSESEAWSEPDRKVSLARIGLEDHSTSLLVSKDLSKELSVQHAATDSESDVGVGMGAGDALNHSRTAKMRAQQQETIVQLESLVSQRDERILQIQCQLVEADNRLKKENLRVIDLTQEVKDLRERNDQLHADLIAIGTEVPHELSSFTRDESILLRQIEDQAQMLENIQDERDRLALEARFATQQINELKTALEKTKVECEAQLKTASEAEQRHLREQRERMEAEVKEQLEEKQQLHTATLEQLTELQRRYVEAQRCIDGHIENAKELRQTLVESELNSRSLKKQLDESALQASQALMERTKALNDKMQLEQTLEQYKTQLDAIKSERKALQDRIEVLERSLKASEDDGDGDGEAKRSSNQLNGSDISQSGYTSEEVAPLLRPSVVGTSGKSESIQRMNNSSPDLGIESDAGRVSSVELANVHRSLLMKIEMPKLESTTTKHDSDAKNIMMETDELDTENRPPNGCIHDCTKVEQELGELRRKLTRTKRALEDTYQKLRNSNQVKAQIERDIKNQIIKTHNVLKNVRSNMELEK